MSARQETLRSIADQIKALQEDVGSMSYHEYLETSLRATATFLDLVLETDVHVRRIDSLLVSQAYKRSLQSLLDVEDPHTQGLLELAINDSDDERAIYSLLRSSEGLDRHRQARLLEFVSIIDKLGGTNKEMAFAALNALATKPESKARSWIAPYLRLKDGWPEALEEYDSEDSIPWESIVLDPVKGLLALGRPIASASHQINLVGQRLFGEEGRRVTELWRVTVRVVVDDGLPAPASFPLVSALLKGDWSDAHREIGLLARHHPALLTRGTVAKFHLPVGTVTSRDNIHQSPSEGLLAKTATVDEILARYQGHLIYLVRPGKYMYVDGLQYGPHEKYSYPLGRFVPITPMPFVKYRFLEPIPGVSQPNRDWTATHARRSTRVFLELLDEGFIDLGSTTPPSPSLRSDGAELVLDEKINKVLNLQFSNEAARRVIESTLGEYRAWQRGADVARQFVDVPFSLA